MVWGIQGLWLLQSERHPEPKRLRVVPSGMLEGVHQQDENRALPELPLDGELENVCLQTPQLV